MLSAILHKQRKAAAAAVESAGDAVALTKSLYGTRLLVRGLLWVSIYFLSRGLLEMGIESAPLRVLVALLPTPFFAWYLWTWMKGVALADELQRRIELEALGFAFPAALVVLMTIGLLDVAQVLDPNDFSLRHAWLMLPLLYYIGLAIAKRRYA